MILVDFISSDTIEERETNVGLCVCVSVDNLLLVKINVSEINI